MPPTTQQRNPYGKSAPSPGQSPLPIHDPANPRKVNTFVDLIARDNGNVAVACDTEFNGPHTLTIQFATRLSDNEIAVQVYSSPPSRTCPTRKN
jgi:hypothetical protein